jgi:O-antigen ligase
MDAPLAVASAPRELGMVVVALAVASTFVLRSSRARAVAVLLALVLIPVLLVGELWDSDQLQSVRDHPLPALAAAVAGLVVMVVLARVVDERPALFAVLAVIALPFRVPVDTGEGVAYLLIPLYLVVGGGGLAYAWRRLREPPAEPEGEPGALELALLGFVVLYAVQAAYSSDFDQALKNVVFFYAPFALLLRLLTSVEWSRRLALTCFGAAVSLSLVFAAVGFFQYATRDLFWNPKVIEANQFESYFRVNSLFFDPNIYGRFLAIVVALLAAAMLWARRPRAVLLPALAAAVLWAGLAFTFSRSSFAALLAGLVALAAIRWPWRPVATAVAAIGVVGIVVVAAFPSVAGIDSGSRRGLSRVTSGRSELIGKGLGMFADRPLFGFGAGSFSKKFKEREHVSSERANSASHTIPVTVAAEQGLAGLAAYLAVVLLSFSLLFRGLGALRERAPPRRLVLRAAVAAAYTVLVAHTLMYAAFLEDPLSWALIGIGIGLSAGVASSERTRTDSRTP